MLVSGRWAALEQHAGWLIGRIPERVRTPGRNEHAATRARAHCPVSVGRFPVLPGFLYARDRLECADLEFSFQDIEELFRVCVSMRPDIETGRNHHLETRRKG